ncbi:uncharacterized protein LOC132394512 isoform X3 [Hypanus sabinus]|uniref:uncharacterized protein LOC132394512 isoform X3 n=1 Tax=Hypanus sabinus TaxID=79690 RepID=UPI0028C3CF80|nr:uncharacterized protein LOC132394512 isoform X3 [Hypanus sabinus]
MVLSSLHISLLHCPLGSSVTRCADPPLLSVRQRTGSVSRSRSGTDRSGRDVDRLSVGPKNRQPWVEKFMSLLSLRIFSLVHLFSLLLQLGVVGAEAGSTVAGARGSSILLDPGVKVNPEKNEILWSFTSSHKSPLTILHYIPSFQKWAEPSEQFNSRLQFIQFNGSLMVNRLQAGDQGDYSFTMDSRLLKVISVLVFGLPLVETSIVVTSIIGIVFSVVSFFGLLLLCFFRREKESGSLRQLKYLFLLLFICNTLSLLVISIALGSWIAIKGAASASVVTLFIVVALLPLNVCLTITIWNQGCQCIRKFLDCTGLRASIDFCGVMSSVIVIAISIVILIEEIQQSNQGCHVSYLTWSTVAPLIIVAAIIFFSFLIVWKRGSSSSSESNNEGTPQDPTLSGFLNRHEEIVTIHCGEEPSMLSFIGGTG